MKISRINKMHYNIIYVASNCVTAGTRLHVLHDIIIEVMFYYDTSASQKLFHTTSNHIMNIRLGIKRQG